MIPLSPRVAAIVDAARERLAAYPERKHGPIGLFPMPTGTHPSTGRPCTPEPERAEAWHQHCEAERQRERLRRAEDGASMGTLGPVFRMMRIAETEGDGP